jgi:hypothetical protein
LSREFPGQSRPWIYPAEPENQCLYIDFHGHIETEFEPDEVAEIVDALGQKPDVSLAADVSGRHPGVKEVAHFVKLCLRNFRAVAGDDYSSHAWTLSEIQSRRLYLGHPFFDYVGWHEEDKQRR